MWQLLLGCMLLSGSCTKSSPRNNPVTYGSAVNLFIDKSMYKPGEAVQFTIDHSLPASVKVRYRHLGQLLKEEPLTGTSWQWVPPATDFTGYLVDLYETVEGREKIYGSIAVDVSSDWSRFPRYGFLSQFGAISDSDMNRVIAGLTRYHLNGLQFYDWHFKHHEPLAGSVSNPDDSWLDIAHRTTLKKTVQGYISRAHQRGMNAMFYNLCYGALSDAAADGVAPEWYMYKDKQHQQKDLISLPNPPFKSDIWFVNPANTAWQQYLAGKNSDVYQVYDFDGYHVDQVGDRGIEYDYNGNVIDLKSTFKPFLESIKAAAPSRRLVMNAVNQFGQEGGIAQSPVDFLYSEVWAPDEGYKDLARVILDNDSYSNQSKRSVLAAYVNYNLAEHAGYFNPPGVLMADAVIFAFGGDHLELGEHMLGKEYFPNDNLKMTAALQADLVRYYDFLVAYQNLLRDGGVFNSPSLTCVNGKMNLNNWPPQSRQVSIVGKSFSNRQVIHLINFTDASTFGWRDADGLQTKPVEIDKASLSFTSSQSIARIWMASPDIQSGVSMDIPFVQNGSQVSFTLPSLLYWDMVVIEFQ